MRANAAAKPSRQGIWHVNPFGVARRGLIATLSTRQTIDAKLNPNSISAALGYRF
jgi:outer membrane protein W